MLRVNGVETSPLHLRPQHVLLRSHGRRVADAGRLADLVPELAVLERQRGQAAGEHESVVRTLHRGDEAQPDALHVERGQLALGLGHLPAQSPLAGIGDLLAGGHAQHRHLLAPEAGSEPVVLIEDAHRRAGPAVRLNGTGGGRSLELLRSFEAPR